MVENMLDFTRVNTTYERVLSVKAINDSDSDQLHDLSLVRHVVAHHAGVFRDVDVPRLSYYEIQPGLINPLLDFAREVMTFLYDVGQAFEAAVRHQVILKFLATLPTDWAASPPSSELRQLLRLFNFFGHVTTAGFGSITELWDIAEYRRAESARVEAELTRLCVLDLQALAPQG